MLEISTDATTLQTTIKGEFWDFDRLYFAISKYTGDFGVHPGHVPFPGYEDVCETLLGLNYTLRQGISGKGGLHEQFNGLTFSWLAPIGEESRVYIKSEGDEGDAFNIGAFEDSIFFNLPEEIDMDDWGSMARDEQENLLIDIGFDYEEIKEYFDALDNEKYYYFAKKDYPNISEYNAWISCELPFFEALYYALLIEELMAKKDSLFKYYRKLADITENTMWSMDETYYYCGLPIDLARITLYMEGVYRNLYELIGAKEYAALREAARNNSGRFVNGEMKGYSEIVEKYSNEIINAEDDPENVKTVNGLRVSEFLRALLKINE